MESRAWTGRWLRPGQHALHARISPPSLVPGGGPMYAGTRTATMRAMVSPGHSPGRSATWTTWMTQEPARCGARGVACLQGGAGQPLQNVRSTCACSHTCACALPHPPNPSPPCVHRPARASRAKKCRATAASRLAPSNFALLHPATPVRGSTTANCLQAKECTTALPGGRWTRATPSHQVRRGTGSPACLS